MALQTFRSGVLGAAAIIGLFLLGRAFHLTQASPELALGQVWVKHNIDLAWIIGSVWFLINGGLIALLYAAVFRATDRTGWGFGALLGIAQALIAAYVYQALLMLPIYLPGDLPPPELVLPPERLGFGEGPITSLIILGSHGVYGAILGATYKRALQRQSGETRSQEQKAA